MGENPQDTNESGGSSTPPEYHDRREMRRQWREERRAGRGRGYGGWIGGAILVLIGIIILFQNLGLPSLQNWWALFILLPAFGSFASAWRMYEGNQRRLNAPARGSIIFGLVLVFVTAIFLFNLSWTWLGPILLILAGLGLIVNIVLPG